ncbi:MAG TPA: tetratricopeptide repeat protein, partial [Proteobacteria bacterium]|nr:tetratricopeptide repeat protein [Pseudomonadota bacterium]
VYIAQKRYEQAVEVLQQVLRLKSDYPEARLDLGIAYLKLGKTERAKMEFERALALDPQGEFGKQARKYLELLR